MLEIQGKVWGETAEIYSDKTVSVHFLKINSGGYCSEHLHTFKETRFCVLEGAVLIRTWREPGSLVDETRLMPGSLYVCPPGVWHQFEAIKDSRVIEIYTAGLHEPDIERRTQGGKRTLAEIKARERDSE